MGHPAGLKDKTVLPYALLHNAITDVESTDLRRHAFRS